METRTSYLDANVFIYAAQDEAELGKLATAILWAIQNNELRCATSCLTIDEVLYVLKKRQEITYVVEYVESLLSSEIVFFPTSTEILFDSLEYFQRFNLRPRDSIHCATMRRLGITTIISEDKDFDRIPFIKRIPFKQAINKKT